MNTHAHMEDRIQLWFVPVAAAAGPEQVAGYEALLDAEERARWQRFRFAEDRWRFLLGRAFMRTVLADCLEHSDPAALQFRRLPQGKPELAGADSGKLHFNLSHTDALLVLAVSRSHV